MLTHLQLQRLWKNARYRQLIREILNGRPEAGLDLDDRLGGPTAAAALALLRLVELNQPASPLACELVGRLLFSQGRDGAWGSDSQPHQRPVLTALCLRALASLEQLTPRPARPALGMSGTPVDSPASPGRAVGRGILWLAAHQQEGGGWEGGALATGLVLLELGRDERFRRAVHVDEAWSSGQRALASPDCPAEVRLLWSRLRARSGGLLEMTARAQAASAARLRRASERFAFADVA